MANDMTTTHTHLGVGLGATLRKRTHAQSSPTTKHDKQPHTDAGALVVVVKLVNVATLVLLGVPPRERTGRRKQHSSPGSDRVGAWAITGFDNTVGGVGGSEVVRMVPPMFDDTRWILQSLFLEAQPLKLHLSQTHATYAHRLAPHRKVDAALKRGASNDVRGASPHAQKHTCPLHCALSSIWEKND